VTAEEDSWEEWARMSRDGGLGPLGGKKRDWRVYCGESNWCKLLPGEDGSARRAWESKDGYASGQRKTRRVRLDLRWGRRGQRLSLSSRKGLENSGAGPGRRELNEWGISKGGNLQSAKKNDLGGLRCRGRVACRSLLFKLQAKGTSRVGGGASGPPRKDDRM